MKLTILFAFALIAVLSTSSSAKPVVGDDAQGTSAFPNELELLIKAELQRMMEQFFILVQEITRNLINHKDEGTTYRPTTTAPEPEATPEAE